jgi:hypothetical protein
MFVLIITRIRILLPLFFLACFCNGCLKRDVLFDYSGIKPVVLIPNANWPAMDAWSPAPQDSAFGITTLQLYARFSFQVPFDKDLKVNFIKDDALAVEYNSKWGTNYQLLPDNCYQAIPLELTIPAGSQQAAIPITLYPARINGSQDYIIAYTIKTAEGQTIASNQKSMVFTLKGQ